jgi:hypothetical protein
LNAHANMADYLDECGEHLLAVPWHQAALWITREMSPHSDEQPTEREHHVWMAVWTMIVTKRMGRLAHCLADANRPTQADLWFMAATVYRVAQFGENGAPVRVPRSVVAAFAAAAAAFAAFAAAAFAAAAFVAAAFAAAAFAAAAFAAAAFAAAAFAAAATRRSEFCEARHHSLCVCVYTGIHFAAL